MIIKKISKPIYKLYGTSAEMEFLYCAVRHYNSDRGRSTTELWDPPAIPKDVEETLKGFMDARYR